MTTKVIISTLAKDTWHEDVPQDPQEELTKHARCRSRVLSAEYDGDPFFVARLYYLTNASKERRGLIGHPWSGVRWMIGDVYMEPHLRGKTHKSGAKWSQVGFGKIMIAVKRLVRGQGVMLWVYSNNHAAIALYHRIGFRTAVEKKGRVYMILGPPEV